MRKRKVDRVNNTKPSWIDVQFDRFRIGRQRRDPCPRMQSVSEKRLFSAKRAETVLLSSIRTTVFSRFRQLACNPEQGRLGTYQRRETSSKGKCNARRVDRLSSIPTRS